VGLMRTGGDQPDRTHSGRARGREATTAVKQGGIEGTAVVTLPQTDDASQGPRAIGTGPGTADHIQTGQALGRHL